MTATKAKSVGAGMDQVSSEPAAAHLRIVLERPAGYKASGIHLAGVSKTYGTGDGKVEGKGLFTGASAELMVPKWFDKRPHLSIDDTVLELRQSLWIARDLYRAQSGLISAFGLHAACIGDQLKARADADIRHSPLLLGLRKLTRLFSTRCCAALVSIFSPAWRPTLLV